MEFSFTASFAQNLGSSSSLSLFQFSPDTFIFTRETLVQITLQGTTPCHVQWRMKETLGQSTLIGALLNPNQNSSKLIIKLRLIHSFN